MLKFDEEQKRVTLGYKQKKPDPWSTIDEKIPCRPKIKGNVVNITEYGVFIELEKGLEGLVHISEIDWLPKPKHPSKYLSIGETVEAVILKADKNDRRLSLSIKQLKTKPVGACFTSVYSSGQQITGKVKALLTSGCLSAFQKAWTGLCIYLISHGQSISNIRRSHQKRAEDRGSCPEHRA